MGTIQLEPLRPVDFPICSALYRDYARSWNEPVLHERLTEVWNILMSPKNKAYSLGAFSSSESLLGFCHYMLYPCTYSRSVVCYLQDLYVAPEARRNGIARAFMSRLKQIGREEGWNRIQWKTRPENIDALALYDQIAKRSDWIYFELQLTDN